MRLSAYSWRASVKSMLFPVRTSWVLVSTESAMKRAVDGGFLAVCVLVKADVDKGANKRNKKEKERVMVLDRIV